MIKVCRRWGGKGERQPSSWKEIKGVQSGKHYDVTFISPSQLHTWAVASWNVVITYERPTERVQRTPLRSEWRLRSRDGQMTSLTSVRADEDLLTYPSKHSSWLWVREFPRMLRNASLSVTVPRGLYEEQKSKALNSLQTFPNWRTSKMLSTLTAVHFIV